MSAYIREGVQMKRKTITKQWLREIHACNEAITAFNKQKETDALKILNIMIKDNKIDWANWLIVRLMTKKQKISYGIYTAQLVLRNYEKVFPFDNRPRSAEESATRTKILKYGIKLLNS
jgi:dTDP-4-amino-4,6-dideoxygalactose transaminase